MEVTETKKPKTYAEYQKLKEGEPYQLIYGRFVKSPSPTVNHQRLVKRLEWRLIPLEKNGTGELLFAPIDVYFTDTEVYQPDIIFISKERLSIIKEKVIEGAPDLIIEVLSPSTGYYDLRRKRKVYEASGVKEYWIVDPMEKSVEVYENSGEGFNLAVTAEKSGRVSSLLYPDFCVDTGELFASPPYE
jgi:Uma2 family endonuclease